VRVKIDVMSCSKEALSYLKTAQDYLRDSKVAREQEIVNPRDVVIAIDCVEKARDDLYQVLLLLEERKRRNGLRRLAEKRGKAGKAKAQGGGPANRAASRLR
jgi:hypothetical protein